MQRGIIILGVFLLLIAVAARAQDGAPAVPVRAVWHTTAIPAGGTSEIGVIFDVPKGHHITDVKYELFFVKLSDTLGLSFGKPVFPPGVPYREERAYRGRTVVRVPVTATDSAVIGSHSLLIQIGYQLCREFGQEICFLPVEREITLSTNIVAPGTAVQAANDDWFAPLPEAKVAMTLEERLMDALNKGSWLAFVLVFVGGFLTSFTPCVYPIIPITIGYIGGASTGRPLRGLGLSAIFVLGIALVYSSLGLVSAATGSLFGAISGSPIVTFVVAGIFFLMGLSMLGAFEIALPASLQSKLHTSGKGSGLFGPLLIGMISGLVMAPCVGPVIVALLAWVSKTGNLFYGWALLFVFSLGLGLLFLIIGTFSGALQALPRAGMWMDAVKRGFGWILLAAALYILRLTIPEPYYTLSWAVLLVLFSVFAGAFDALKEGAGAGARVWKAIALLLFILGAIFLFKVFGPAGGVTEKVSTAGVSWLVNEEEAALAQARDQGKPLIVDVYADWCVACVELDEKTYVVPEVVKRLDNFVRLKLDFTKETPWVSEMKSKYQITGMPTVIVYDPSANEAGRFTGFKSARDFLTFLDRHSL